MTVTVTYSPMLGIPTVTYKVFKADSRGDFMIPLELSTMEAAGLSLGGPVRQLNLSTTFSPHTARGIHVSNTGKFVFAPLAGDSFYNVVVNLRDPDDPSFGRWEPFELSRGRALYVPPGFGNAIQAYYSDSLYGYLLDGDFDPAAERVVDLTDPEIGIAWPYPLRNVSDKDRAGLSLADYVAQQAA